MASYLLIAGNKLPDRIQTLGLNPVVTWFLNAGRLRLSLLTAALIASIALSDYLVGNTFSLGVLYILPMMSGAVILSPSVLSLLAILCATLRYCFDTPGSHAEVALRFLFASVSYFAAGLFVHAILFNRSTVMKHLAELEHEQQLRAAAEKQMEMLIASSSAAILTMSAGGAILAANNAAVRLFLGTSSQSSLIGLDIGQFMPLLSEAARTRVAPQNFRTAAQCQGRRLSGELFQAHTWFSSYTASEGARVAAIVVDSSEEMREREDRKFNELARSSRITAAALSHEIRNLCAAINVLAANLNARHALSLDEDHRALVSLVKGLEKVASLNLSSSTQPQLEAVELRRVLDDLRIVIEADWLEIEGVVSWPSGNLPLVLTDPHGLLQVFLNLSKNSLRAVANSPQKTLAISLHTAPSKVSIQFLDSGPGVSAPDRLFRPFDPASDGSGLGLYISRTMLRTCGGDLRYLPTPSGACFIVELETV